MSHLKLVQNNLEAFSAKTMSVFLKGSKRVQCYIQLEELNDTYIDEAYANVTLRFDRGDAAMVCGLPQHWTCYDDDNEMIEEYARDGHEGVFFSEGDELQFLEAILIDMKRQKEEYAKDLEHKVQFNNALNKIETAIKEL